MENNLITEEQVKKVLESILNENISKISRQDFGRVQFKIDELLNSLNETIKEFRKLQDSMPVGLKQITNKKLGTTSSYLYGAQQEINNLKESVKIYKRKIYTQQIDEKKK